MCLVLPANPSLLHNATALYPPAAGSFCFFFSFWREGHSSHTCNNSSLALFSWVVWRRKDVHCTSTKIAIPKILEVHYKLERPRLTTHLVLAQAKTMHLQGSGKVSVCLLVATQVVCLLFAAHIFLV